ncbi:hypothetical protein [Acetivibrio straminisolvens]|jgi:hypothetical protein|uniref:hypothetical protein n=1 Tax=Acetivibrio straminisolvens TaxID=253314 RepID=UPI00223F9437|nr:hypothetical protein [Acetivibrio straminisolvens]
MKVKILNIIFIASLLLNVYFILKNANIHKIKEEESILSYLQLLNLEDEKEVSNDNVDITENNPIDNFFDEHKLSKVNSITLRRAIFLYMQS